MKPIKKDDIQADSSYLALLQSRKIAKPVLSFTRRLVNDENDSSSANRISLKRPEPNTTQVLGIANKKCRCSYQKKEEVKEVESSPNKRKENIMKAVLLSEQDPDLIGDCSKPYALPVCRGKHSDLKTITPETLAALIRGVYKEIIDSHTIIDGRYPYEFEGGHILNAVNIYDKRSLLKQFLENKAQTSQESTSNDKPKRHILIFHCEFSSERGPSLLRFLRNKDRELNTSRYPNLYHPELYLLEGGYKAFYEKFKDLCSPQSYLPMLSKEHKDQMIMFRTKTKSYNNEGTKWSSGSILRCERKFKRIL